MVAFAVVQVGLSKSGEVKAHQQSSLSITCSSSVQEPESGYKVMGEQTNRYVNEAPGGLVMKGVDITRMKSNSNTIEE